MYFAYMKDLNTGKLCPTKWLETPLTMDNKPRPGIIASHKITPEQWRLSLNELVELFPPPDYTTSGND